MTPIDVGSTIGDYQVIGVLGAGGMGKVFKVKNAISDRVEAMKVLLPDLTNEPDLADRFLREIKVLASLSHPNIAGLHTALRFENQLLMLMELVEGITLEQRLQQGPLSVSEAVDYVGQALSALAYAHQRGVVHRDIKPANMMLTANGVIKLMDFGIAKSAADRRLTMTGTTMGSLYYMSPEQIRGVQVLDARSDLYSVGVSLYELVTGKRPFEGESQFSIMSAHLERDPVPPVSLDPSLPAALNEIILLSVQREPERRFQTAEAFRNALASVVPAAAPAPAPTRAPAPPPPAVAAASKSHRGLWIGVGALCAVAAVVAVIELGPSRKASAGASPVPIATPTVNPDPVPAPAASIPPPSQPQPQPAVEAPKQDVVTAKPAAPIPTQTSKPVRPPSQSAQVVSHPPVAAPQPQPQPQTPTQAPVQQPPAQASQPAPSAADAAKRAEMMKARQSLAQLSVRANAIHGTLQGIQRSQAASGLGLRRDWVEAANLMDAFLRGANDAMNAGDLASAQDLMGKAEIQADKLDKSLR
jgi:eukaryotic-like serine/threonine-protein kinase